MTKEEKLLDRQKKKAETLKPRPILLPSGKWRCQCMVNGERISAIGTDPESAHAELMALKHGIIKREQNPAHITVLEAIDRYIESKDAVLSPTTLKGYKKTKKLMGDIGNIPLSLLTREKIQRWVNKLSKDLSPKTVRNAHGLLSAVLAEYKPDLVLRTTLPQKDAQKISIPTEDELKRILTAAEGTEMELPILLAVWLGLRASEIRGITWDSIEEKRIHICKAMVDGENGPVIKKTKTTSGDRWIPLPDRIYNLICTKPKNGDYIINLSGQAMYKRFSRLCEKHGIPHYRFHDLRHMAASVSIILGVPDKYSQQRMGHKTDNMLKTVYQHTLRSKEDEYAERINGYYEAFFTHEITHEN